MRDDGLVGASVAARAPGGRCAGPQAGKRNAAARLGLARAGRRMPHLLDRDRTQCVSRQGRFRSAKAGRPSRHHGRQAALTFCSRSNCRRSTASVRAWSKGSTAPAFSPSRSSGTRRRSNCAAYGTASMACSFIRCCTVSTSSRPPPVSPRACSPRPPSACAWRLFLEPIGPVSFLDRRSRRMVG